MAQAQAQAHVATPLPPAPSGAFMSEAQWETFFALVDGALPSLAPSSAARDRHGQICVPDDEFDRVVDGAAAAAGSPPRDAVVEFLGFRSVDDPRFREDCVRTLAASPHRMRFAKALALLDTYAGSFLLTGYLQPVSKQPTRAREAILKSWTTSRLLMLRMLAKTVSIMAQKAHGVTSPHLEKLCGYTDIPQNWKPVQGYDFKFIQLEPGENDDDDVYEITTDVVIVGSGCGGGVSAKNLAEAGHKVLVVDKGYYFPPTRLPMTQEAGLRHLYDRGGSYMSEDSSTGVGCGGSWGGGGTVNWSVCLRPQDYVRREWAGEGLPLFASPEFDECLDRVWGFAGAGAGGVRHNHRNRLLLEGAGKLGWHAAEASQNTAGREHYCGQCHLGCGSAEKRGPAVAWLPAAAEAGAEFMEGFRAERVLFDEGDGVTATGVEGVWTSRDEEGGVHGDASERTRRRVVVRAKKVILSAGALWSPILLMNSGVENPRLGYNLHLHPVNCVTAVHREETRPWEGGIITSYSGEFENLDGKGHGVKLEPVCLVPYLILAVQGWSSGLDAKLLSMKLGHLSGFISLVRDRDSGRVFPDAETGEPRIEYTPSDFDRDHVLEGVQALAKICYVGGATEIRVHYAGVPAFAPDPAAQARHAAGEDPEFADPAFGRWLRRVRDAGNRPPACIFTSAHQMGTCRMGASEGAGVVDEAGRVWGRRGLYVADASVFPSASGVNPMVTVMALADWISRGVARELSAKG